MVKKCFTLLAGAFLLAACSLTPAEGLQQQTQGKMAELSSAGDLSTAEYTVTKIIKASDCAWYKVGDRKILFNCRAYVEAGIDMREYNPQKTKIDEDSKSISLILPKVKVLSLNMPVEEAGVQYEKISVLRSDFSAVDRNNILQQGEQEIRKDLPNMGILKDAENNARIMFTSILHQIGYENININFE